VYNVGYFEKAPHANRKAWILQRAKTREFGGRKAACDPVFSSGNIQLELVEAGGLGYNLP